MSLTSLLGAAEVGSIELGQAAQPGPTSDIVPSSIGSVAAVGTPSVSIGTVTCVPDGVASVAAVGAPSAHFLTTAIPTGIASVAAVGTPTVAATITAAPAGVAGPHAVGSSAAAPSITIPLAGIASQAAVGGTMPIPVNPPTPVYSTRAPVGSVRSIYQQVLNVLMESRLEGDE